MENDSSLCLIKQHKIKRTKIGGISPRLLKVGTR